MRCLGHIKRVPCASDRLAADHFDDFPLTLTDTKSTIRRIASVRDGRSQQYKLQSYRLQFQDWAFLKAEWRKFTDRFSIQTSIIVCGRAGYEYDMREDEDTHKKQLEKTGIKFKAEGEVVYEPDLLVLMERRMNMATKADRQHRN